jgi:hypothetical protein
MNILKASHLAQMAKEEQLLATILSSSASAWIDNATHKTAAVLTTIRG